MEKFLCGSSKYFLNSSSILSQHLELGSVNSSMISEDWPAGLYPEMCPIPQTLLSQLTLQTFKHKFLQRSFLRPKFSGPQFCGRISARIKNHRAGINSQTNLITFSFNFFGLTVRNKDIFPRSDVFIFYVEPYSSINTNN